MQKVKFTLMIMFALLTTTGKLNIMLLVNIYL